MRNKMNTTPSHLLRRAQPRQSSSKDYALRHRDVVKIMTQKRSHAKSS
ncbi:hypothetical protein HN588_07205 [Candidatus Bathyarchaeota archaeon]|nr:hypothetical protein [Candidatus Bathyarchaeota archaeon]